LSDVGRTAGSPPGASTLEEDIVLDVDARGRYHLLQQNSKDDGREVISTGGLLYVKPRYGRFVERRPESEAERDRPRFEAWAALRDSFAVVAAAAQVRFLGVARTEGRVARKLGLSLSPEPVAVEPPVSPGPRPWREQLAVQALQGAVILDGHSGAPLRAELHAQFRVERGGRTVTGTLELTQTIDHIGQLVAIDPPVEVALTPTRRRYATARDELLKGLTSAPASSR
jgi:hypothetical protein